MNNAIYIEYEITEQNGCVGCVCVYYLYNMVTYLLAV